jgi:hypothetical protein
MMLGEMERVGNQYVTTKMELWVFPRGSMHVLDTQMETYGNTTRFTYRGIDLPTQWKSWLLGTLRVVLGIAWPVSPFVLMWGESVDFGRPEWNVTYALFGIWLALLIFGGRLGPTEKKKRLAMKSVTGLAIDPARLYEHKRAEIRGKLGEQHGFTLDNAREICAELTQGGDHDSRVAAYTYGRYAAPDRPSWRAAAATLWPLIAPQFAKARA